MANPFTASSTEVGACLKGSVDNADSVKSTECGTPDANFKVVGKQENKSEIGSGSRAGPNARTTRRPTRTSSKERGGPPTAPCSAWTT
ncbi:LppU/SCO3897 family protein [Amycolatopsis japonica]